MSALQTKSFVDEENRSQEFPFWLRFSFVDEGCILYAMFFPRLFLRYFPLWQLTIRAIARTFAPRLSVSGRSNIPHRGAVIFAPNHGSDFDPPLLGAAIHRPVAWMAKRELWEIKWLAPILTFVGCFPVDPDSSDRAALRRAEDTLKQGFALVVFPEGKISRDGSMGPLLPGTLMLAMKAGVPIVPVGMSNACAVLPYGKVLPKPTLARVHLHFGAAIHFDDLKELPGRVAREKARERLELALRAAHERASR